MLSYIEFHGLCELAFWAREATCGYVSALEYGASIESEHVVSMLLARGLIERTTTEKLQPHVQERLDAGEIFHRLSPAGMIEVSDRNIPGLDHSAIAKIIAKADRARI